MTENLCAHCADLDLESSWVYLLENDGVTSVHFKCELALFFNRALVDET